jgi:lipopolysaccharide transport system permease protein
LPELSGSCKILGGLITTKNMDNLAFLKPFGIDIFCVGKKYLVFNLVGRNLKVKYRRSVLGLLWTLVSPLALTFIFYFVFKVIMKVQVPHFLAFLVSGIIPWSFFSQTVVEGLDGVVGNAGVVAKVPVPVQVFPFVGCVTNFITLALAFPIIFGVSFFTDVHLGSSILLLPLIFFSLFFMSYGLSLFLGLTYVYFRDLKHIVNLAIQLWFYGTPVFYNPDMVPAKYHWLLIANPAGGAFVSLHKIFSEGTWPASEYIVSMVIWAFVIMSFGFFVFKKTARDVVENL